MISINYISLNIWIEILIFQFFNCTPTGNYMQSVEKKYARNVPKVDHDLFSSSTVLCFYWVVERHNAGLAMTQFGLKQVVPPPFSIPFLREE